MEHHLAQVPAAQHIQDQRNPRELEVHREEFQTQNRTLEEKLARQEDLRIAKERLSSQTIDVEQIPDGDGEVEHLFGDASAQVDLVEGANGSQTQSFGPTSTDPSEVPNGQHQMEAVPLSQER